MRASDSLVNEITSQWNMSLICVSLGVLPLLYIYLLLNSIKFSPDRCVVISIELFIDLLCLRQEFTLSWTSLASLLFLGELRTHVRVRFTHMTTQCLSFGKGSRVTYRTCENFFSQFIDRWWIFCLCVHRFLYLLRRWRFG